MRLTLVQVLMNSKGYNMNPLQSLYYVSPACFISLLLPFRKCHVLPAAMCCQRHGAAAQPDGWSRCCSSACACAA